MTDSFFAENVSQVKGAPNSSQTGATVGVDPLDERFFLGQERLRCGPFLFQESDVVGTPLRQRDAPLSQVAV
ncbi:MAG: hypothetical protein CL608_26425 [Anaerolineaceae bacterium]|nr:hypothetical protein [Anaerolineaceae bacterium]